MERFKGTKGKWFINKIGPIPIGINSVVNKKPKFTYSKNIVEIILPDNDDEWDLEKKETEANLRLIVNSKELLKNAIGLSKAISSGNENDLHEYNFAIKTLIKQIL